MWSQAKGFKPKWFVCSGIGKLLKYTMKIQSNDFDSAMAAFVNAVDESMSERQVSNLTVLTAANYCTTTKEETDLFTVEHSKYFIVSGESRFENKGNCDVIIAGGYDVALYIYQDRYPNNVAINADVMCKGVCKTYNIPFKLEEAKYEFTDGDDPKSYRKVS